VTTVTADRSRFPQDFAWGTATASYQVEGATDVDGRGPSIWDTFSRVPGAIADGRTGDLADDHYRRFREDVAMLADLGTNAYRFSIAWPRIQADGTGPANPAGLRFYRELSEALLERGITPWVTLYHWDLPQALEDRGGWLERDTAQRFGEYASLVVDELGDVIDHWATLNEPWCSAFLGYAGGVHAPGRRVGSQAARAAHHLLLGHGLGMQAIRAARPEATAGVVLNLYSVRAASESAADQDAARRVDGLQNRFFLEPLLGDGYPADVLEDLGETEWFAQHEADAELIAAPIDFLGINYYSRHVVAAPPLGVALPGAAAGLAWPGSESVQMVDTGAPRTQMGWPIHPEGMVDVLEMAHRRRPELPLYITENGSAYPDEVVDGEIEDEGRRRYLEQHVLACSAALQQGLPLKGYFAWTSMDNFEWAWGYSRRFGLVHVDYETQKRTVKRSGKWFARFLGGAAGDA
jgi:beta-glucosidase